MAIPSLTLAHSRAGAAALRVERADTNVWWAWFASNPEPRVETGAAAMPSSVLSSGSGAGAVTLAKVELDACGAWVTLANDEPARPIVVRRAGWVDVRGHPHGAGGLSDDRVGLGPGDALLLSRHATAQAEPTADEAFLDCLLGAAGDSDAILAAALDASDGPHTPVVVLSVPGDLGDDPHRRVADAIGVDVDELELPGYPLADLQPELWAEAPTPPRLARIRLADGPSRIRDVRQLLDRLIASWRLDARVDDDALKLAASELASNAFLHAGAAETATVRFLGDVVRIEVDDHSTNPPVPLEPDPDQPGGRGLQVVETISDAWGTEMRPAGKRVWCEVAVAAAR